MAKGRTVFEADGGTGLPAVTDGITRHVARAGIAEALQRAGRHAAAERLLLDVTGALLRRGARGEVAATLVSLGRLRLERGRTAEADRALAGAVTHARAAQDAVLEARAVGWLAAARADAARLAEAEALCGEVLAAGGCGDAGRLHLAATRCRVLLWQGRIDEAVTGLPGGACDDVEVRVYAETVASRVCLASGDAFAAGRRAHAVAESAPGAAVPLVRIVALTGLLRVALAGGDLDLGRRHLEEIARLARQTHCGLRAIRARLLWVEALARAGLAHDARRELDRLARRRRALPALVCRRLDALIASPPARGGSRPPGSPWRLATELVSAANRARSEIDGAAEVVERTRALLGSCRVEIVRPVDATATPESSGAGARVIETGMPFESRSAAGTELGVPVSCAGRPVGALVATWTSGTPAPRDAREGLEVAAAVIAPWLDALDPAATDAARLMPELVGGSLVMQALRRAIARAARAPFAVLIEGESGTGKELVARALHRLSPRREKPFRDVNCAALPDELVESELFGHVRGAFTGAIVERAGLVEEADGGTIFLDEVADLSLRAQAKVLRVIQEQEVRRVGAGGTARRVDTRVVSAANRDLRDEAAAGRFRPDLLYRLDVIRIRVPPLRERLDDVPALARHCWREAARRVGSMASLDGGVVERLCAHRWPGNVRELQNVIAGLAVRAPARGRVEPGLLPSWLHERPDGRRGRLVDARLRLERELVEAALVRAGGRRTQAARELGLSRQGPLKLMARVGLSPGRMAR